MCRLAIYGGLEFRDLARGLHQLETSLGGDGNGYYHPDYGTTKGIDLTTAEVAFATYQKNTSSYFHTRMATTAYIEDAYCHPFSAGTEGVLLHNGQFYNYALHAKKGEHSDTEVAARLVSEHGVGVLQSDSFHYAGVWIVANEAGSLVTVRGGDFYFQWLEDGGFFHASEPITGASMKEIRVALDGEVYFVANDGEVSVVTSAIERVRMPKAINKPKKKGKKSKGNWLNTKKFGKPFSGATETSGYWDRIESLEEMEQRERETRALELRDVCDTYGYDSLTDWEQDQLKELDRQLEDDGFFKSIKPTSWED